MRAGNARVTSRRTGRALFATFPTAREISARLAQSTLIASSADITERLPSRGTATRSAAKAMFNILKSIKGQFSTTYQRWLLDGIFLRSQISNLVIFGGFFSKNPEIGPDHRVFQPSI